MNFFTLEQRPHFYSDCIKLIETSFGYDKNNHFDIDFYQLMAKENFKNCHLLIDDEKLVGHIGVLKKKIKINDHIHLFHFYGGIAIDNTYRGRGIFRKFFNHVLSLTEECSLKLLWSDKLDLYKKFSFYPAILQNEYKSTISTSIYKPTKYSDLNSIQKKKISQLYENEYENRILRTYKEWEELSNILSTNLYIREENEEIKNYFFRDKGADLNNIIHEYGFINKEEIKQMLPFGKVWTPHVFTSLNREIQFGSLVAFGKHFRKFIADYTLGKIEILKTSGDVVSFKFNDQNLEINTESFITGILGPNQFEELQGLKPIYISGLDSI